jgi:hypothetical protein
MLDDTLDHRFSNALVSKASPGFTIVSSTSPGGFNPRQRCLGFFYDFELAVVTAVATAVVTAVVIFGPLKKPASGDTHARPRKQNAPAH